LRRAIEADNIFVVSLSSNGQRVLVGSGEGDLRYFDVETNQLLSEFPSMGGLVRALAQTGDGHFAAATYHDAFYLLDLLSAETMIARYYSSFTQFSSLIGLAVAISEDARFVLVGLNNATSELWDMQEGIVLHKLGEGALRGSDEEASYEEWALAVALT